MSFEMIFEELDGYGCRLVEVTGGEPLAQKNAFPFISELCDRGYEVLIETGGYVSIEDVDRRAKIILDIKCPASGEVTRNHWPNLGRIDPAKDEVKFVIADLADWDFSKKMIEEYDLVTRSKEILISPVHGVENLAELAEAVAESGLPVRFNMQLHKYIWGADARGV